MSKSTQDIINLMISGNEDAIIYGSSTTNPLLMIDSILFGLKFKVKNEIYIENLKKKTLYGEQLCGTRLSTLYDSALDLMGIEKYTGDDETVLEILNNGGIEI